VSIDGGLRPIFRQRLRQFHWTSIETGGTGQGIADSNYLHEGGIEGWIEFKQTEGWSPEIDPHQVAWIFRRARLGGRAMVAVRRRHAGGPRRGAPVDELYVVPGRSVRELRARGLLHVPHWRTAGGPAAWDWPGVAGLLLAAPERPQTDPEDAREAVAPAQPGNAARRRPGG
jgi:hypothetical protein